MQKNKACRFFDTPYFVISYSSTAARAVENEKKENNNDDPRECFVFKEVA